MPCVRGVGDVYIRYHILYIRYHYLLFLGGRQAEEFGAEVTGVLISLAAANDGQQGAEGRPREEPPQHHRRGSGEEADGDAPPGGEGGSLPQDRDGPAHARGSMPRSVQGTGSGAWSLNLDLNLNLNLKLDLNLEPEIRPGPGVEC